jgi:hypothetical protein
MDDTEAGGWPPRLTHALHARACLRVCVCVRAHACERARVCALHVRACVCNELHACCGGLHGMAGMRGWPPQLRRGRNPRRRRRRRGGAPAGAAAAAAAAAAAEWIQHTSERERRGDDRWRTGSNTLWCGHCYFKLLNERRRDDRWADGGRTGSQLYRTT